MTEATNERVIRARLEVAAQKAGIIDLDALALADMSKVTLEANGEVKGAEELMIALKEAKPYLFQQKKAKDMTPAEREAWWKEHKRRPKLEPLSTDKKARDMSEDERRKFLDECRRRE